MSDFMGVLRNISWDFKYASDVDQHRRESQIRSSSTLSGRLTALFAAENARFCYLTRERSSAPDGRHC
ncbi:hypothetical protein ACFWNN_38860 [Lentzea sp. NPDC058450]|uniref:hypothetical protein n=1 Tax=Lentzea sp. NPDC058450 TaxID=3346505 RepID=UPI003649D42F